MRIHKVWKAKERRLESWAARWYAAEKEANRVIYRATLEPPPPHPAEREERDRIREASELLQATYKKYEAIRRKTENRFEETDNKFRRVAENIRLLWEPSLKCPDAHAMLKDVKKEHEDFYKEYCDTKKDIFARITSGQNELYDIWRNDVLGQGESPAG